jgi:hypothetical protein
MLLPLLDRRCAPSPRSDRRHRASRYGHDESDKIGIAFKCAKLPPIRSGRHTRNGLRGQALAYAYYEEEPGRRAAANLLTKEEARRVASNIAKLPKFRMVFMAPSIGLLCSHYVGSIKKVRVPCGYYLSTRPDGRRPSAKSCTCAGFLVR